MAGAGYKSFSTGDVLTASDLNTYGIEQTVMVFASSTARDPVLSSAISEGMFAFLKDSDSLTYYDGSSWVVVDLTGDITGVTAGTNLSGGGTGGTVTLNLAIDAAVEAGSDGNGVDVTFHSATAGDYAMWDASEEKLIIEGTNGATALDVTDGNVVIGDGTLTVGSDGAGEDVTFHSDTAGDYMQWDSSAEKLILEGTNGATVLDVTDGNVVIGDGTLTVGADGAGEDVTFHSDTAGDYMQWDSSAEKLILEGTNGATVLDITDGNVVIGDGTLTVGSDGAGEDVTFHSDTAGDAMVWDSSAEKLTITGTDSQTALDVADGNVSIADGLTVTGTTALSTTGFGDATVSKAMMKDYSETTNAIGATSASQAIDLEDGNVVTATLSVATTTFTFSNPIASDDCTSFTLILTQDGTGSRAVTWPGAVDWAGGTAPTLTTTAAAVDIITFVTVNAGTTWYGFVAGQDMK